MNEICVWSTDRNFCREKMKVCLSATVAIKTALRQVEWIVRGRIFLELSLHWKPVILADNFVASNLITSKENILFCVISCLKTVFHYYDWNLWTRIWLSEIISFSLCNETNYDEDEVFPPVGSRLLQNIII